MPRTGPKTAPKRVRTFDLATEELFTDAVETLRIAQGGLRKSVDTVLARLDAKYTAPMANHLCNLQRHAAAAVTEIRQIQKHQQSQAEAMSDEQRQDALLEYLADAPAHFKAKCLAALGGKKKSVL